MNDRRLVVTGANGFVGRAFCLEGVTRGMNVTGVTRDKWESPKGIEAIVIKNIDGRTNWSGVLTERDVVIHLAARVHVMREKVANPLDEFREVNVHGTLNLARQAAAAGVRRFLFVSSVKVHGEVSYPGQPFSADDLLEPFGPYAVSKMEAEQGLLKLSAETGMEIVIVRPPLVYGPGVGANFAAMMRALKRRTPLPFGAVQNRRSLVSVHNLVDLMMKCLWHPAAAGNTFLVSDGEDVSTAELLRRMGQVLGCPALLLPIPPVYLKIAATLAGKRSAVQRLCGSLQVDISKTRRLLDWRPPFTLDQELKKTAEGEVK